jgi:hypothetical protein
MSFEGGGTTMRHLASLVQVITWRSFLPCLDWTGLDWTGHCRALELRSYGVPEIAEKLRALASGKE